MVVIAVVKTFNCMVVRGCASFHTCALKAGKFIDHSKRLSNLHLHLNAY